MAGGEGTRLRPLTSNAPKPMLPLANRPMMEHIISLLKQHGFDEIIVTVAFLANHIKTCSRSRHGRGGTGGPSSENPLEFGIVITREAGSIERFLEKPTWGQVFSDTINTGIYVLEPEIFDFIPEGRSVDFSREVFPALLAAGRPMFCALVGRTSGRGRGCVAPSSGAAAASAATSGSTRVSCSVTRCSWGRMR